MEPRIRGGLAPWAEPVYDPLRAAKGTMANGRPNDHPLSDYFTHGMEPYDSYGWALVYGEVVERCRFIHRQLEDALARTQERLARPHPPDALRKAFDAAARVWNEAERALESPSDWAARLGRGREIPHGQLRESIREVDRQRKLLEAAIESLPGTDEAP